MRLDSNSEFCINHSELPSDERALLPSSTRSLNSSGSNENAASCPPSLLFMVRCFSITVAPNYIAATLTPIPRV